MKVIDINGALEILNHSKGRIMVAVQNLAKDSVATFHPRSKEECQWMIKEAQTICLDSDNFFNKLELFTEKQEDSEKSKFIGIRKILLFIL